MSKTNRNLKFMRLVNYVNICCKREPSILEMNQESVLLHDDVIENMRN